MNILEMLLGGAGGGVASQIAKKLGLPEALVQQAVAALTPALARGLQKNAAQPGGLDSLLGALKTGNHARFVDEPEALEREETVEEGNAILGHILGSKDVSRSVASDASRKTGIEVDALKKMLPMLGAAAMGSLSKQTDGGTKLSVDQGSERGADPLSMLSGLLGTDDEGSMSEDILALTKKLF